MKTIIARTFTIGLLICLILSCSNTSNMPLQKTVTDLELQKFLGKWYEIARYPHSFEKGLQAVTASYSMRPDGKIKVINQGHKGSVNGELSTAIGKAKIPDLSKPGNLKVSFFWIFYADYLVLELDNENYEWAIIGSSSPNYLWILSRKPQMEDELYQKLIKRIENRGYDLGKLILVEQK